MGGLVDLIRTLFLYLAAWDIIRVEAPVQDGLIVLTPERSRRARALLSSDHAFAAEIALQAAIVSDAEAAAKGHAVTLNLEVGLALWIQARLGL